MSSAIASPSLVLSERKSPATLTLQDLAIPASPPGGTAVVKPLAVPLLSYTKALLSGDLPYPLKLPLVPGGSAIARIHRLPPDATTLTQGQLVFVDATIRSRDAPEHSMLMGIMAGATPDAQKLMQGEWRNGTLTKYAKVPLENLFALDEHTLCGKLGYGIDELGYLQRLMVPMGGVSDLDVKVGDRVVIAPATGGFGGAAVEVARALGADVVICGRSKEKLESVRDAIVAKDPGSGKVDIAVISGDVQKDVGEITKGGPVDKYLDFSPPVAGNPSHMAACFMSLRHSGIACLMGGIQGNVDLPYGLVMMNNLQIKGNFMYGRADVTRLISLLEGGKVKIGKNAGIVTKGVFGLKDWEKALAEAEAAQGWGVQVVMDPTKE